MRSLDWRGSATAWGTRVSSSIALAIERSGVLIL